MSCEVLPPLGIIYFLVPLSTVLCSIPYCTIHMQSLQLLIVFKTLNSKRLECIMDCKDNIINTPIKDAIDFCISAVPVTVGTLSPPPLPEPIPLMSSGNFALSLSPITKLLPSSITSFPSFSFGTAMFDWTISASQAHLLLTHSPSSRTLQHLYLCL